MKKQFVLLAALLVLATPKVFASVETLECSPLVQSDELSGRATFFGVGDRETHVALFLPADGGSSLKKYVGDCASEVGPLKPSLTCRVDVADYEYTVTLSDRGEHGLIATYAPAMSMQIPEMLSCKPRK